MNAWSKNPIALPSFCLTGGSGLLSNAFDQLSMALLWSWAPPTVRPSIESAGRVCLGIGLRKDAGLYLGLAEGDIVAFSKAMGPTARK